MQKKPPSPEANTTQPGNRAPKPRKLAYAIAVGGIVITLALAVAVVYYWQRVRALEGYGYAGAFLISIVGGATILIPVPMLAVVFALGGVMEYTWLVGFAAGLGETVGALTIYMTGYGSGAALHHYADGHAHTVYNRILRLIEKRGGITLFLLSAILNPFFYPAALAAGAAHFGLRRYFWISLAGKTIKGMTVAYAGFFGLRGLLHLLGMPG